MILSLVMVLQAVGPAGTVPVPPWTPRMRVDPVTGQASGSVSATSQDGSSRLVVRCDRRVDNVVSIQFIPNAPFTAAAPRPVSITVDGGSALNSNWEFPGRGAVVSDETVVTNLALAIARGREIKVHLSDPADKTLDATFAGPSSEAPIKQVLGSCGYTLGTVPVRTPAPAAPSPR